MADARKPSFVLLTIVSAAVLLCAAIFLADAIYGPDSNRADIAETRQTIEPKAPTPTTLETTPSAPVATSTTPATIFDASAPSRAPEGVAAIPYSAAQFTPVANSTFTAVFCDRGAVLSLLRFVNKDGATTHYRTPLNPMDEPRHPLQLLGRQVDERHGDVKPETLDTASAAFDEYWDESLPSPFCLIGSESWRNSVRWTTDGPLVRDDCIELAYVSPPDADGLALTKRYRIYDAYKVVCELEFTNRSAERAASPHVSVYGPTGIAEYLQEHREAGTIALYESSGGAAFLGKRETFTHFTDALGSWNEERQERGTTDRTLAIPAHRLYGAEGVEQLVLNGITNGYFIAAIGTDYVPSFEEGSTGGEVIESPMRRASHAIHLSELHTNVTYNFPNAAIGAGQSRTWRLALYAGPYSTKDIDQALAAGMPPTLDGVREVSWSEFAPAGWPEFISAPITLLLRWLKDQAGSVGIAIMLLTLLVRLMMSPLSVKAQISMQVHGAKMKTIKPRLDEIKEKYKDNKSREGQMLMFQETRAAMKSAGVGFFPIGGCLPLLLQMPIFIALYNSLRSSFLLYQEPFLWIHDLSRPDAILGAVESGIPFIASHGYLTLNILPIVWFAMMMVMQARAPKATDQQQRQMQIVMKIMPVMMMIFFYALPAGFVLYFVASIVFSFVESTAVRRYLYAKGIIDNPRGASPETPMM